MEEIFARTINAVCAETGVSREDILSGKHDESTVDARYLLDPFGEKVQYLSGRVAQLMFPVAGKFLCGHCRKELGA